MEHVINILAGTDGEHRQPDPSSSKPKQKMSATWEEVSHYAGGNTFDSNTIVCAVCASRSFWNSPREIPSRALILLLLSALLYRLRLPLIDRVDMMCCFLFVAASGSTRGQWHELWRPSENVQCGGSGGPEGADVFIRSIAAWELGGKFLLPYSLRCVRVGPQQRGYAKSTAALSLALYLLSHNANSLCFEEPLTFFFHTHIRYVFYICSFKGVYSFCINVSSCSHLDLFLGLPGRLSDTWSLVVSLCSVGTSHLSVLSIRSNFVA